MLLIKDDDNDNNYDDNDDDDGDDDNDNDDDAMLSQHSCNQIREMQLRKQLGSKLNCCCFYFDILITRTRDSSSSLARVTLLARTPALPPSWCPSRQGSLTSLLRLESAPNCATTLQAASNALAKRDT